MNKMQTFPKARSLSNNRRFLTLALFCSVLLYLPHCGNLPEPPGSTPSGILGRAANFFSAYELKKGLDKALLSQANSP